MAAAVLSASSPTAIASRTVSAAAKALENTGSGSAHAARYTVTDSDTLARKAGELNSSRAASRMPGPM